MTSAFHDEFAQHYKNTAPKLSAVMMRLFGTQHAELVDDIVQDTFGQALEQWQANGIPATPEAWLMLAAKHRAIDLIRRKRHKIDFSEDLRPLLDSEWSVTHTVEQAFSKEHIVDDLLRMMFLCCRPEVSAEFRLPFILRTLFGLSIPAICNALLLPEATIKKRLLRTRNKLRALPFEIPSAADLPLALDSVHTALYLVFNEGYYGNQEKEGILLPLCFDATGLLALLCEQSELANRDTYSLRAQLCFLLSRKSARFDADGNMIPLDMQDRRLWDRDLITQGQQLMELAMRQPPGASGRFVFEAAIAYEHCCAAHFDETRWTYIQRYYQQLLAINPSPVVALNGAIAQAYAGDLQGAKQQLLLLCDDPVMANTHMAYASLAHICAMLGQREQALNYAEKAKTKGGTQKKQDLMMEQIARHLARLSA